MGAKLLIQHRHDRECTRTRARARHRIDNVFAFAAGRHQLIVPQHAQLLRKCRLPDAQLRLQRAAPLAATSTSAYTVDTRFAHAAERPATTLTPHSPTCRRNTFITSRGRSVARAASANAAHGRGSVRTFPQTPAGRCSTAACQAHQKSGNACPHPVEHTPRPRAYRPACRESNRKWKARCNRHRSWDDSS